MGVVAELRAAEARPTPIGALALEEKSRAHSTVNVPVVTTISPVSVGMATLKR